VGIARQALSPTVFGLVLVCFFLPFVDVSCQRTKVAELTGIRLVTGSTVERPRASGQGAPEKVERGAEPLASFAFLACLAGIGLNFLGGRKRHLFLAGLGLAGVILLILLKIKLEHDVLHEAEGLFRLDFRAGYWLALAGFCGAGGLNLLLFFQGGDARLDPG
jgi:hypothetical protein